jgi:SAM-dependent methyltransferase
MVDEDVQRQGPGRRELADSFGGVASHYERFRPGPPTEAVAWYLPEPVTRVVDLGAGTGALTRLLLGSADDVVAVEPDERMRALLTASVPGATALAGTGESIPLPDGCADGVLASTSWHWMDPERTLAEVARVLVPGGVLGALWTAPDPDGAFLTAARDHVARSGRSGGAHVGALTGLEGRGIPAEDQVLVIPEDAPFDRPDRATFSWDIALDADELIGLLGTFSWVITMPEDDRRQLLDEARALLGTFGIEGSSTVDVAWRTDAWRTRLRRPDGPPGDAPGD